MLLGAAGSLAGCSRDVRSARLPAVSPDDEIYRISCERTIRGCREEAAKLCSGRYEVLGTSGASIEPERVTSAPGPASTGPRYQRRKWVGQLVVACGGPPTLPLTTPASAAQTRAAAAPAEERLCIPGATQQCLGPGACRGAQACLPDGDGYGACDCGDRAVPAASGAARQTRDAGAPAADGVN